MKINHTLVKILPTGVESKNSIGALKMELVKQVKKDLEALNPRRTPIRVLKYIKKAPSAEITV